MVPEDLVHCTQLLNEARQLRPRTILLLSPNITQFRLFRTRFPAARLYTAGLRMWDLNRSRAWRFDLIFAGNVMHYSPAPALWFDHILDCCGIFMVQDLITRRRSATSPYLALDGDAMRYSFRNQGVEIEHSGRPTSAV